MFAVSLYIALKRHVIEARVIADSNHFMPERRMDLQILCISQKVMICNFVNTCEESARNEQASNLLCIYVTSILFRPVLAEHLGM